MRPGNQIPRCVFALLVVSVFASGCRTLPYQYGKDIEKPNTLKLEPAEPQVERGRPHAFLDGLGNVLGLPSKLILWNWKVDNHDISPDTEAKLNQYLADNDLHEVKIRLNEYSPGSEWHRLKNNKAVHPGWRYTLGALTVVGYTIFPGRAFGGDNYNPYTNTVNLYSDHKGIALHEAGHAKDFAKVPHKGVYGAVRVLPIVPLFQEEIASSDAISYDAAKGCKQDEKNDYKILYPAFGTYVAGEGLQWFPVTRWVAYAAEAAVVIPAHVIGRAKAAQVDKRPGAAPASSAPAGGTEPGKPTQ